MAIADLRREYNLTGLRRRDLEADPIDQFKRWFDQAMGARASGRIRKFFIKLYKKLLLASGAELLDLTAMTLATADKQGRPSARVVLLKGVDQRGFIFFTNYESRKGQELAENPAGGAGSLLAGSGAAGLHRGADQPVACRQNRMRISGRGRAGAAWRPGPPSKARPLRTGRPSKRSGSNWKLNTRTRKSPRPPFWGGYLLSPARMEFWQGRPNRLHDRFRYTRQPDKTWLIERLSP